MPTCQGKFIYIPEQEFLILIEFYNSIKKREIYSIVGQRLKRLEWLKDWKASCLKIKKIKTNWLVILILFFDSKYPF